MRKTLRPKVHINKLYRLREKMDRRLSKLLNAMQEVDQIIRAKLQENKNASDQPRGTETAGEPDGTDK